MEALQLVQPDQTAPRLVANKKITISHDFFRVPVDYFLYRKTMIALGKYDRLLGIERAANYSSPKFGVITLEARYASFKGLTSSEEAEKAILLADPALPWAPADFDEMLAFGKAFPQQQAKPIIGLGMVQREDGCRGVTCLSMRGMKRSLGIACRKIVWSEKFRFLIVRPL